LLVVVATLGVRPPALGPCRTSASAECCASSSKQARTPFRVFLLPSACADVRICASPPARRPAHAYWRVSALLSGFAPDLRVSRLRRPLRGPSGRARDRTSTAS